MIETTLPPKATPDPAAVAAAGAGAGSDGREARGQTGPTDVGLARKGANAVSANADLGSIAALIAEVRLLLEFVAGSNRRSITELQVEDPRDPDPPRPEGTAPPKLGAAALIRRLEEINAAYDTDRRLLPDQMAMLRLTKDALVGLVSPATGLTVAYTSQVVASRDGRTATARLGLAEVAYPGLVRRATWHRWGQRLILALAVLLTAITLTESAKVALGKALLQTRQDLRMQQVAIQAEKLRLESLPNEPGKWSLPPIALPDGRSASVDFCERPRVLGVLGKVALPNWPTEGSGEPLRAFETPQQRDVCDRDRILAANFGGSFQGLAQYEQDWTALVGPPFSSAARAWRGILSWIGVTVSPKLAPSPGASDDIEFVIAAQLLVLGNYLLPVIFAALGAAAFVVLDFYGKVKESTLAPRDHLLAWIRLVLGLLMGACVGLFFSSYGPVPKGPADSLIQALTLSASGIGFLAGFGVEGVFSLLDATVRRVFATEQRDAA